ncbi:MAG: hypothetical protein BHV69_05770 [Bacteroidales bacterium 52_46]|nr:MAG: hypothetical protein BHV69_05770 [Bacteroidales bacterium 52_46]
MGQFIDKNMMQVDMLLSELDRNRIDEFIKKECNEDTKFRNRFLALGAGTVFAPSSETYSSRIHDLIDDFSGRHGYIEYRDTFDFNHAVFRIFEEADEALKNKRWRVVLAILTGMADCSEDIINSGDDSAGELGAIVDVCFEEWMELASNEELPDDIGNEIFELALARFENGDLKGWDWWWYWIDIAITLADTADRQERVINILKAIKPDGDDWSAKYHAERAQSYLLKIMAKCGTPAEQRKFMYDNVSNPDFRTKLIEIAWDEEDYDEVLRLATEGEKHDSEREGLIYAWRKWEFKVYQYNNDKEKMLHLARYFFFGRSRLGENEYSMEAMYSLMKSLVDKDRWHEFVESLLNDKDYSQFYYQKLYIYTQEKMWDKYMAYLRKNTSTFFLENSPKEVRDLYKNEFIGLYTKCIREFFVTANNRDRYKEGVELLKKLMDYGGEKEAITIIEEQKARRPRRPALIEELSKI